MFNDRVALHGFGKMFMHFFNEQLKNGDFNSQYKKRRGGQV